MRAEVVNQSLQRHLPDFAFSCAAGGSSVWVQGPDWLDSRALAERVSAAGVLIELGDVFFQRDDPPRQYFRLGFSSIPASRIEAGVQRLGEHVGCAS